MLGACRRSGGPSERSSASTSRRRASTASATSPSPTPSSSSPAASRAARRRVLGPGADDLARGDEVHGLTAGGLAALGATPSTTGSPVSPRASGPFSREGVPVVGCNLAYDLTIVDRVLSRFAPPTSLRRAGRARPRRAVLDRGLDDGLRGPARAAARRALRDYGVAPPTDTAVGDAVAAVRVLFAQATRFPASG